MTNLDHTYKANKPHLLELTVPIHKNTFYGLISFLDGCNTTVTKLP